MFCSPSGGRIAAAAARGSGGTAPTSQANNHRSRAEGANSAAGGRGSVPGAGEGAEW